MIYFSILQFNYYILQFNSSQWPNIVTGVLGILMVGILIYGLIKEKAVLLLPILIYIPISSVFEIIIAIIGIVAIDDPHI